MMKPQKVRSYTDVTQRLKRAATKSKTCRLGRLGEIKSNPQNYPFYSLTLSFKEKGNASMHQVCLSGGIHGDEPAGVEAMITLLEDPDLYEPFLAHFDFIIFPCINPYGYEHNTRTNGQGIDLNRQFDRKQPPEEVALVRGLLEGKKFAFSMEFHEDVDTDGFYLYELKKQEPYFGEAIIQEVAKYCPINLREKIEGLPSSGGIIRRPIEKVLKFRSEGWPQAIYQIQKGTPHTITCETPIALSLKDRAKTHLIAFSTAIQRLL